VINQFKDEYAFLSNFHPWNVVYRGSKYATAEHAFQAAKGKEISDKLWIAESSRPGVAKRRGRKVELREDWDSVKMSVMLEIVQSKFFLPWRKEKLVATGDHELVEGNYWHDNIWGICLCSECDNYGKNYLGKILMLVRKHF
jgi:hypothetical protein